MENYGRCIASCAKWSIFYYLQCSELFQVTVLVKMTYTSNTSDKVSETASMYIPSSEN